MLQWFAYITVSVTYILRCNMFKTGTNDDYSFQRFKNKLGKLTDMIEFCEFPLLFLEILSAVTSIQYLWRLYGKKCEIWGSSMNGIEWMVWMVWMVCVVWYLVEFWIR